MFCHQCYMLFLHMMVFGLTTQIMITIYTAAIESVLTLSITIWFGSITVKKKLRLNKVVKTGFRIIGRDLANLESLYQQRLLGRASFISHDSSHPAHDLFDPLPSSCWFRSIKTRANRFSNRFFPQSYKPCQNRSEFSLICGAHIFHFQCVFSVYILT